MIVWTFWFSIPEKHIYLLKEDTSLSERTSDVYLVTDSFGGNFNCDVAGPLRYLFLLDLKEATLHVSRDGQQLYSKITFFKDSLLLLNSDIPSAPPLSKRNAIKDGFFSLEEIFVFVAKCNVHEIRVRWLLYDVEWNHMIYPVNVSSLFSEHNLHKNYVENDWQSH